MDQLFQTNLQNQQNDEYFVYEPILNSQELQEKNQTQKGRYQTDQTADFKILRDEQSQFNEKQTKSEILVQFQKQQNQQLTLEDLIKIKDNNQNKINNIIAENNDIFDEELEQVFYKIQTNPFQCGKSLNVNNSNNQGKQGQMVRRYKTDSELQKDNIQDSIQQLNIQQQQQNISQLSNKQSLIKMNSQDSILKKKQPISQQEQDLLLTIQCQNKIMSQINFYQMSISFINKQILNKTDNWLNKILIMFVQIFTECWRNKHESLESLNFDFFKNSLKNNCNKNNKAERIKNENINFQQNNSKAEVLNKRLSGSFYKDSTIPLLKENSRLKDSQGIQQQKDGAITKHTKEDIQRFYVEINKFINIFRNLVKTYYDIPFVSKKINNSDFFMDDVLWNNTVNLIFECSVDSRNIYSYQLQMSTEVLQNEFEKYKKIFSTLVEKEPQFYKIKDKFCLNHLTKEYISKQIKSENERTSSINPERQNIKKNENDQNEDKNQKIQRKESTQSQSNQLLPCNSQTSTKCFQQSSKMRSKSPQSILDNQDMKRKEVEEHKLNRERLPIPDPIQNTLVVLTGVKEKDRKQQLTDMQIKEDETKEEFSCQEIEREESKDSNEEGVNDSIEEEDTKLEVQQDIKKVSYIKQENDKIQVEEFKDYQLQQEQKKEMNTTTQPFEICIKYLKNVAHEKKVIKKLKLILKAFENIQKCIQTFYDKNNSNEKVKVEPENLMDITVYILAKSQQYKIIHDIDLVRQFITKNIQNSHKAGYYLLTLEAAFEYIITESYKLNEQN